MWNPYQLSETRNNTNNNNMYTKSNSPIESIESGSGSSSTNSSTSEKLVNQNLQPLSIASLIPTPSYDDDEQSEKHNDSTTQQQHTQQNEEHYSKQHCQMIGISQQNMMNNIDSKHRSSLGSSDSNSLANSSDLSSISATSTPTYRSPPSSFSSYNQSQLAPSYNSHLHAHYQMQTNYHQYHFGGLDFGTNPYSYANYHQHHQSQADPLKISSMVKQDFDYANQQQRFNPVGIDQLKLTPPPALPPQTTTPPSALSFEHNQFNSIQNQNPYAVYYNNMNLNVQNTTSTSVPAINPYAHYNSSNHQNILPHQPVGLQLSAYQASATAATPQQSNNNNNNQRLSIENKTTEKINLPSKKNNNSSSPSANMQSETNQNNDIANRVKVDWRSTSNPNIKVKLQDMSLWKQFQSNGTEMIITKVGRRMFPTLRVSVSGLEPSEKYVMIIDVIPYDENRYKYHNGEWIVSGKAEQHFHGIGFMHPDQKLSGSQWMKQIISFHKLKLTNNPFDRQGHIILNSMHKYIPRLHIICDGKTVNTITFTETIFIAVTAYQNEAITKLKIQHNPFAKGFRDGQNRKDYRTSRRSSDDENDYDDHSMGEPASTKQTLQHSSDLNQQLMIPMHNNNQFQQHHQSSQQILGIKDMNKFNPSNINYQLNSYSNNLTENLYNY